MRRTVLIMFSALAIAGTGQSALSFEPLAPAEYIHQAAAVPDQITMDENSGEYTINWRGQPDKVVIRWKLMAIGGEIIVCGNYAMVGHSNRKLSQKALHDTSVMMDGRPLVQHASAFNEVSSANRLVGSSAKCIRTGVAAPQDPRAHAFSIGNPKSHYDD